MPGGFLQPLGLIAFPAIKAAGYTAFAIYLNHVFSEKPRNVLAVGVSRMVVGLVFGTILALFFFPFFFVSGIGTLIYVAGLIPVRTLEWWLIIKAFYSGEPPLKFADMRKPVALGIVTSFLLDIPALTGIVYAASFWIC